MCDGIGPIRNLGSKKARWLSLGRVLKKILRHWQPIISHLCVCTLDGEKKIKDGQPVLFKLLKQICSFEFFFLSTSVCDIISFMTTILRQMEKTTHLIARQKLMVYQVRKKIDDYCFIDGNESCILYLHGELTNFPSIL